MNLIAPFFRIILFYGPIYIIIVIITTHSVYLNPLTGYLKNQQPKSINGPHTPPTQAIRRHRSIQTHIRRNKGPDLRRHHRKILLRSRRRLRHVRGQRRQQSPSQNEQKRRGRYSLSWWALRQRDRSSQWLGEEIRS